MDRRLTNQVWLNWVSAKGKNRCWRKNILGMMLRISFISGFINWKGMNIGKNGDQLGSYLQTESNISTEIDSNTIIWSEDSNQIAGISPNSKFHCSEIWFLVKNKKIQKFSKRRILPCPVGGDKYWNAS